MVNGIEGSVYQRIWDENAAFMKLKLFFDQEYFSFTRDYISLYNFENVLFFDPKHSSNFKDDALIGLTSQYLDIQASNRDVDGSSLRDQFIADQLAIFKDPKNLEDADIFSGRDQIASDPGLHAIKLATILSQDIITKVKDVQHFVQWMQLMDSLYEKHAVACVWLLKYLTQKVCTFFL